MTDYDPYSGRPRKQVPAGTRDARTGEYVRRPVPVRDDDGGSKPPKSTCVCMVMATVGGFGYLYADALHRYGVDLTAVIL